MWCGLWVVALAVLLATVLHTLRVGNDLRFFLPRAATPGWSASPTCSPSPSSGYGEAVSPSGS